MGRQHRPPEPGPGRRPDRRPRPGSPCTATCCRSWVTPSTPACRPPSLGTSTTLRGADAARPVPACSSPSRGALGSQPAGAAQDPPPGTLAPRRIGSVLDHRGPGAVPGAGALAGGGRVEQWPDSTCSGPRAATQAPGGPSSRQCSTPRSEKEGPPDISVRMPRRWVRWGPLVPS